MAWDKKRYENVKKKCSDDILYGTKNAYIYMQEYVRMVTIEDYEACKAIAEVLLPVGYNVADTHDSIPRLNGTHN